MGAAAPALGRALGACLLLLLTGCGGGGATAAPTTTTARLATDPSIPCPSGYRCARLTVPRDGADPGQGTARLRTLVQEGPRSDRVLVALSGGPGQPGAALAPHVARLLDLDGVRVVSLDQRGTGPDALRCPGLQDRVGSSDVAAPGGVTVRACARRLGDGIDDFATSATVADLEALRRALGAPRLDLLGISYGTYAAERYALAHPATTGRLVLDSVVPQAGAEVLQRVPLQAAAPVLRAVCGACSGRLRAVLTRRPELALGLFDALTTQSVVDARFPGWDAALRAAVAGDPQPLERLITIGRMRNDTPARLLSAGLHAATLCADSPAPWPADAAPADRERALAAAVAALPPGATGLWPPALAGQQGIAATCARWPAPRDVPPPEATIRAAALLLNGTRDLSTPIAWARAQARRMPAARLVELPGAGHSVLGRSNRARDAARAFLRGG